MADFETVRKLALGLTGVEQSTMYGAPAFKVRGELLACMATNKSAEPNSLGVRIAFESRDELIANAPDLYYLTDHYLNYPVVLVRLSRIRQDALRDLLSMAWRFVTAKKPGRKRIVQKQTSSRAQK